MSTLTSSSTYAQITAAYDDNASYLEDASVAKAKAFVTACTFLLRRIPTLTQQQGSTVQHDVRLIQAERDTALQYIHDNDDSVETVRHASFEEYRV